MMMNKKKTKNFTFIDLFAGVGGFHSALHDLGGQCVFVNEFNKHAQKTYEYNFKRVNSKLFGDKKRRSIYIASQNDC